MNILLTLFTLKNGFIQNHSKTYKRISLCYIRHSFEFQSYHDKMFKYFCNFIFNLFYRISDG